jgi:hypothetical protein
MQPTKQEPPSDALPWRNTFWWSTLPNWKDERQKRFKKNCLEPHINPSTYLPYSKNAMNYRDKYVFVWVVPYLNDKPAAR